MAPVNWKVRFVDLRRQTAHADAILRVIDSGRFIGGEEVESFEREFAAYIGTKYAVGVGSGADALRLSLLALGVGPGDEVVTVSHTFVATADAIVNVGAKPVFVDVEPERFTMDPDQLAGAMSKRTKAIIPVHLYGQPADMDPIQEVAEEWGVPVVEDAAQAHGASYKGHLCGSMGKVGCFSFYPSKNLGAFGDGGCVTTDDGAVADVLRLAKDMGQREKYWHEVIGFNSRLDAIQAAVLREKLRLLDSHNESRRKLASTYSMTLPGVRVPARAGDSIPVWHLYVVRSDHRDALREHLTKAGIETGIHYPIPVHLQPSYAGYEGVRLPVTEELAKTILSLPMHERISPYDVVNVVEAVKSFSPP